MNKIKITALVPVSAAHNTVVRKHVLNTLDRERAVEVAAFSAGATGATVFVEEGEPIAKRRRFVGERTLASWQATKGEWKEVCSPPSAKEGVTIALRRIDGKLREVEVKL